MSSEDLVTVRDERQLVDSLRSARYNELSSLREKGLVGLPGDDVIEPPPDVASKVFVLPLRGLNHLANDGDKPEKKDATLLLGPSP